MDDREGAGSQSPGERFSAAAEVPAFDLGAALDALDRATRNFPERLGAGEDAELGRAGVPGFETAAAERAPASHDARMRQAEHEAREYLEHAKRRADSLVNAMVGAVERESAEMRREAEAGIRIRWQQVEADAAGRVEEAQRVAERIVAQQQQRIAALSDGIAAKAGALTAGMDDAERLRAQFDGFVRTLAMAADRIASAREAGFPPVAAEPGGRDGPNAVAA
jgi:hypothetical protein